MLGIALALSASLCWGTGDFLGGFSTRRASLWAVIIGSQAVGLIGAALVTLGAGHGWPGFHAVWPVLLGGLGSIVAISCFYKALAIGSMSVVAPITATNAAIPFLVGLALGERPAPIQLFGVVLAAAGVILVAVEPPRSGDTIGVAALPNEPAVEPEAAAGLFSGGAAAPRPPRRDQRLAVALALLSAVCMGLVLVGYHATAQYDPLWAMFGGRLSSATLFAMVFLVLRPKVGMTRTAAPFIVAVGLLDTGANGLFALATTHGYLSLVSVLGALYPVVTVVLAFSLLRERIARHQVAGIVATLAGVALIAV